MSSIEQRHKSIILDQRGVVSFMIALVFILVALLIVTGFAQLANRNSRIALDSQLSQQAYYAAESGVNDAIAKLKGVMEAGGNPASQTSCLGSGSGSYTVTGGVIGDNVRYTCQLVDVEPDSLSYDSVSGSIVVPVEAVSGNVGSFEVTWRKTSGAPTATTGSPCNTVALGSWPATSAWPSTCYYGVLRLDVLPSNASMMQNADTASASTATAFVYPGTGSTASFAYAASAGNNNLFGGDANQGQMLRTGCNASECTLRVTGLNFPKVYVRATLLYRSAQNLQVAATSASAGESYRNAQAVIDVTGRAQDVVRRIQVRVALGGGRNTTVNGFSEFAVQSNDSICKRYYAAPIAGVTQPGDCTY